MHNNYKPKQKKDLIKLPSRAFKITKSTTLRRNDLVALLADIKRVFYELGFYESVSYSRQNEYRYNFIRGQISSDYLLGNPRYTPIVAIVTIIIDFDDRLQMDVKYMIDTEGNWLIPIEIEYWERELDFIVRSVKLEATDIESLESFGRVVGTVSLTYLGIILTFLIGLPLVLYILSLLQVVTSFTISGFSITIFFVCGIPLLVFGNLIWIGLPYNRLQQLNEVMNDGLLKMVDSLGEQLHLLISPRPFKYFDQVESTQDIAFEWLRDGADVGSVVIADEQIKGRGRGKHDWVTPPNTAIAMSVILHPEVEVLHQITMMGALAIYDILKSYGADDVGIKWPNDVLLKGKKVCGILPESEWAGEELKGVVLGMGINVRVDFAQSELEDRAISIEPEIGKPIDRSQLVVQLLDRIDYWYDRLGTDELFEAWRDRLVTLGQDVAINSHGEAVSGKAESVDSQGAILVRTSYGELKRVVAGDIAMR